VQLSVIIPTLNEAGGIALAIERARALQPLEVIVADGGSSDDTVRIAEAAEARVLRTGRGRAVQQNQGASLARGDVLLFLHADSWLAPECRQQIERALLSSERIPGGVFRHRFDASNPYFRILEVADSLRVCCLRIGYGDQGIFLRRSVFEQVGGFPEVALMEDVQLMRRLRDLGRIVLLPGPMFTSARRHESRGPFRQTLRNWSLLAAEQLGIDATRLAQFYR
jgi:rSAM/selenodomain-associated transferase 2